MAVSKKARWVLLGAGVLALGLGAWAVLLETGPTATMLVTLGGSAPVPVENPQTGDGVRWHGDYFAVEQIDPQTFAIGAPSYAFRAMSYLIVGERRAVLFDTGPGLHDIDGVISQLTDRPVIAAASHLHYDHIGSLDRFEATALADRPGLTALVGTDGRLLPPPDVHLGGVQKVDAEPLTITEWWADGQRIDLGGRVVEVLHTPGHTDGSMMLLDAARGQLYSGDFIYPGNLFAIFPGAHMGDYLRTARRLVDRMPDSVVVYPGHLDLEIQPWRLQTLAHADLADLADALEGIREGTLDMQSALPPTWRINDRMSLLGTYRWNMEWGAR